MKTLTIAALLFLTSAGVHAYEQPEVKFFVTVESGERTVECAPIVGSLGDSMDLAFENTVGLSARAGPPGSDGVSEVILKFSVAEGSVPRQYEMKTKANLAQSRPLIHYTISKLEPKLRFAIRVESAALLATTAANPSWREFDTRMKPNNAFERTSQRASPPACPPAAQLGR